MEAARATPSGAPGQGRTVLLSANSSWNIAHFRSGLIRGLQEQGFRIAVAAPEDGDSQLVRALGVEFLPIRVDSAGASVMEDMRLFLEYRKILRKIRPYAFLGFTAKPNIYGSLAARMSGAKVINNITGLGTVFIKQSPLTAVVIGLYRLALRGSSTVFFQNRDDLDLFVAKGLVRRNRAALIPGDGVDLDRFKPMASARKSGPFSFLLIARLLWDKGVGEFVEAARMVRRINPDVSFQLLGPSDVDNRTAIPATTLKRWEDERVVELLGECGDVRPAIAACDCVVLPSYREGLPRTLLEGSAMGKPLVATNVPGCREVVIDGETGFLCEVRSAESLAEAMRKMLDLSHKQRSEMGQRGRSYVERNYGEALVVAKYVDALGPL